MKAINENAPVVAKMQIQINASAEKVWQVLSNINDWSNWQKEIPMAKMEGELKPGCQFVWKSGGAKIRSEIHTATPAKALGWTGKSMGMKAIHNWEIIENGGSCIVKVEESMEGFMAKLLKGMLNKNLKNGMATWLELLKQKCEA